MHGAIKTVSLKLEAYERLRSARRYPGESFSEVILRARWPEDTITGAELLARCRSDGAHFSTPELDALEGNEGGGRTGGGQVENALILRRGPLPVRKAIEHAVQSAFHFALIA